MHRLAENNEKNDEEAKQNYYESDRISDVCVNPDHTIKGLCKLIN
jgi:hypothetical protein